MYFKRIQINTKGYIMAKPTKAKFAEFLSHYEIRDTDCYEQVSYKVLDCAYDLFCALDVLTRNHNAMKAKILSILQPKRKG